MAFRNASLRRFEDDWGISFPGAVDYLPQEFRSDYSLALDAQPQLVTQASSGIPNYLTTFIDPDILEILTARNKAAEILGEKRKGDFTSTTAIFPVVEHTGNVSAYGDYSNSGNAAANTNFPSYEPFIYQVIAEWGDLELERAGLARIGWAAELKKAQIGILNKFQNLTYFYGVSGLSNYGLLNDPNLLPPISPSPKAAGGVQWWNGSIPNATANEVYNDILSLKQQLVIQSAGNIDDESPLVLVLSPKSSTALNFTNLYNNNVKKLLEDNFPKLRIVTAVQYGALSASNPQGSAAGEYVQLIAQTVDGQESGFCAFNEKLRAFPVKRELSSFRQKMAQGTFGAIIRQPFAFAQMIGV